jgi:Na+:H+ antiporter, NhaA family
MRDMPVSRRVAERAYATFDRFVHVEAASGIVLLVAAVAALLWANSPWREGYHALWHLPLSVGLGHDSFSQSLHFWINDGLMTVFFLVVGMEIRREIHEGALSEWRQALLPVLAALGGVVAPALIYIAFNADPSRQHGWAVPTATDIAFAVGALALLGRSIPANVRVFLLALAIIDDIAAVLIIAFVYSSGLDYSGFILAAAGIAIVLGMQRIGVGSAWAYVLPGAILWLGMLKTGAHPTLSGVALGLLTPVMPFRPLGSSAPEAPPAMRVPAALHPWVAFGVMPLFALANAGVGFDGVDLAAGGSLWVLLGVAVALVVGKPLGVITVSWLAVKLGWCRLPQGVDWGGIVLIGLLAGIGFTMSIFVAMLAFAEEGLLSAAKLGVLLGSAFAGVLGLAWGASWARRQRAQT